MKPLYVAVVGSRRALIHQAAEKAAKTIVDRIIRDLCGRSGGDHWFEGCDADTQEEIRSDWAWIVLDVIAIEGKRQ